MSEPPGEVPLEPGDFPVIHRQCLKVSGEQVIAREQQDGGDQGYQDVTSQSYHCKTGNILMLL